VTSQSPSEDQVHRFISQEIETVPHLEALLLIWNSRPQPWTEANLAHRLYIDEELVRILLEDLLRRQLIVRVDTTPEGFSYYSESKDRDQLLAEVDATYRRDLVRISTMIHSKPPASVREFARAFRITKEPK
jgi:hypothetical protein